MTPQARDELQSKLGNEFFGPVARGADDGDSGSLVQVDKVIELASNVTKPRAATDDVRKE